MYYNMSMSKKSFHSIITYCIYYHKPYSLLKIQCLILVIIDCSITYNYGYNKQPYTYILTENSHF